MGRRSTNTTKSGKFMNPTDQARKEARKRELKKNKKQRKLVRETVLKLKDPLQILEEMLRLDLLELEGLSDNVNEKVVAEKKKKLLETLTRILNLYEKTDKEKYTEIKKFQADCDRKRHKAYLIYQSQRLKEQEEIQRKKEEEEPSFSLSEIALPHSGKLAPDEIPLPHPLMLSVPGVQPPEVTGPSTLITEDNIPHIPGLPPGLIPPGPPPGLPPPLSPEYDDFEKEDQEDAHGDETIETEQEPESSKPDFEIDPIAELERLESEFQDMEQNELLYRDGEEDYAMDDESGDEYDDEDADGDNKRRKVRFKDDSDNEEYEPKEDDKQLTMQKRLLRLAGHDPKQLDALENIRPLIPPGAPPGAPPGLPPGPPPLIPPGAPPGPPPGVPPRGMPPGPPPGRPPGPPPGLPPRPPPGLPPIGLPPRLPPGIPMPGMRPPFLPPALNPAVFGQRTPLAPEPQTVIEKGPEIKKIDKEDDASVISAKPQLRNIRAEVTKFVPTAVKIRRTPAAMKAKQQAKPFVSNEKTEADKVAEKQQSEPTKDDVYAKFMSEMTGFL